MCVLHIYIADNLLYIKNILLENVCIENNFNNSIGHGNIKIDKKHCSRMHTVQCSGQPGVMGCAGIISQGGLSGIHGLSIYTLTDMCHSLLQISVQAVSRIPARRKCTVCTAVSWQGGHGSQGIVCDRVTMHRVC